MPRHQQEVETLRRQNRWYINDAPTTIWITTYPETKTAAGGTVRTQSVRRPPQIVRLVPLDRQRTTRQSLEGFGSVQTEVDLEIIGDIDLEIARGDRFTLEGVEYKVQEVQPLSAAPYLRRATAFAVPPDGP